MTVIKLLGLLRRARASNEALIANAEIGVDARENLKLLGYFAIMSSKITLCLTVLPFIEYQDGIFKDLHCGDRGVSLCRFIWTEGSWAGTGSTATLADGERPEPVRPSAFLFSTFLSVFYVLLSFGLI
jgi:hypothetical protein